MSEARDILDAAAALTQDGGRAALATLVSVEGSTYRREGARLLVPEGGPPVGNISGGCLEQDIEEAAKKTLADDRARLLSFDLTGDDEAVWGWGLGCNGVVRVLVEPLAAAASLLAALDRSLEASPTGGEVTVVLTWLEAPEGGPERGHRLFLSADEGSLAALSSLDEATCEALLGAVRSAAADGRSRAWSGGGHSIYLDVLEPPTHLVVCGAGLDAVPLVELAAGLGWAVDVVDHRPGPLEAGPGGGRFPSARRRIHAETPEALAEHLETGPRTAVVVMSHNYLRDRDYLQSFLASAVPYLGMLGPRKRLERLLSEVLPELLAAGGAFHDLDEDQLEESLRRVHGPAGLDLGGDGPELVAWSILAEILAVQNGRRGGFLRHRVGSIHGAPSDAGKSGAS